MATIQTNQSSATYQYSGSSETFNAISNENQVMLEDFQGLSITKTSNLDSFSAGDIITYTVRITNNSSQYLTGVRIIDNLASGNLAYVLGSARLTTNTQTYPVSPVSTNPLTFTLQQLNVGETITLTYNAQVIFNLPGSVQSLTNSVQGIGYTSTGTITGFANHTIQKKTEDDFNITKSSSSSNIYRSQVFSYYITLRNNTSTPAFATEITDDLPDNFVVTSVYYRIGTGQNRELSSNDYTISTGNIITIPSSTGNGISVPANDSTIITINGYFS